MNLDKNIWTEDEEELCKKLLLEGKMFKEISNILNKSINQIAYKNKKWKINNRPIKYCIICGKKQHAKGYCNKHYDQIQRYGRILEKTRSSKNDYEIKTDEYGQYAEIILRNNELNEVGRTKIDIEDLELVLKRKWRLDNWGYSSSGHNQHKSQGYTTLQNYLLKTEGLIDHIDRDRLNNRKYNLRKSNKSLNTFNKDIRSDNTSGVIGVSWNKRDCYWETYININYKRIRLGNYANIDDAVKARLEGEIKYFKDYAPQKHLFKQYGINPQEVINN